MSSAKTTAMAALAILVVFAGLTVQAQMHAARGHRDSNREADPPANREEMMQRCRQMMERKRKMQQQMQEWDQELEQQIRRADRAQGDAKLEAVLEAVRIMAEQRREANELRTQFMQNMMQHVGDHMAMGEGDEGRQAMMQCPMMQKQAQEDVIAGAPDAGDHEAHHRQR